MQGGWGLRLELTSGCGVFMAIRLRLGVSAVPAAQAGKSEDEQSCGMECCGYQPLPLRLQSTETDQVGLHERVAGGRSYFRAGSRRKCLAQIAPARLSVPPAIVLHAAKSDTERWWAVCIYVEYYTLNYGVCLPIVRVQGQQSGRLASVLQGRSMSMV